MTFSLIEFLCDGPVARLTFNRPDVMNALNREMHGEIAKALEILQNREDIKCLILTGAGRGFCSGQDLEERRVQEGQPMPDLGESLQQRYNPLIEALRNFPFPVICALNGPALGAGAGIALACDIVVAAQSASLVMPFNRLGLIPDSGVTWSLPRVAGSARAMASILLCEPISAEQAVEWGIIWKVVGAEELMTTVEAMAEKLIAQPATGMALTKQALNQSLSNELSQQLALESILQSKAGAHPEYRERVLAFLNRKK